ncbi:10164_t:CDS:1, partial [Cetraspora pellucida]
KNLKDNDIVETFVIGGHDDKSKILQLSYKNSDDYQVMWNFLLNISKREEYKGKCIVVVCKNILFRLMVKYGLYCWIEAKFKKNNDILDVKKDNIKELENIKYYDIVLKIVENMEKNDI